MTKTKIEKVPLIRWVDLIPVFWPCGSSSRGFVDLILTLPQDQTLCIMGYSKCHIQLYYQFEYFLYVLGFLSSHIRSFTCQNL